MPEKTISFEFSQKLVGIQRPLYSFILSMLPHRQDAEDVLQETNLILCKKADEYSPKEIFSPGHLILPAIKSWLIWLEKEETKYPSAMSQLEALAEEEMDTDMLQLSQGSPAGLL